MPEPKVPTEEDLNGAAFSENKPADQGIVLDLPEPKPEEKPDSESQSKQGVEEEEQRVPYSRFHKIHEESIRAQERARLLEERNTELERLASERPPKEVELPDSWVKMYGDSEDSKKMFQLMRQREDEIMTESVKRAAQLLRDESTRELETIEENEKELDSGLENLEQIVQRPLTDNEQSSILDIVDEFTPKDERGFYTSNFYPFEKAYEIYRLRNQLVEHEQKRTRDKVASLVSEDGGGSITPDSSSSNTNPRDWSGWRKHLGL